MDAPSGDDFDESQVKAEGDQWPAQGDEFQASPSSKRASLQSPTLSTPMLKRRRVTRACDECRRKKIKCDGKQPCTHCTVYSYECSYDQPSNRRRNPAPHLIEHLEARLHRAETLLMVVLPGVDLDDPAIDAALAQGRVPPPKDGMVPLPSNAPGMSSRSQGLQPPELGGQSKDAELESMVKATGRLDLDDNGNWTYHGHSSGFNFMQRMKELFGEGILGPDSGSTPFIKKAPPRPVYDSPAHADSPMDSASSIGADLPPRELAWEYCHFALNEATALLRFVHQPSFSKSFNRIYDLSQEDYANEDHKFLPLLYVVMAVGRLFVEDKQNQSVVDGYESAIDDGFKFFRASRMMMDIADCRDLTSLQAIIFMILFLQSSAKLSTCYAYIGVALRSALRMGLHRSFSDSFNSIEAESRKRVFWVIRKMDVYVGALLGLPQMLSDDDIDQVLPTEVDDEYITEETIQEMPEGQISILAAANAHTSLVRILGQVIRNIYAIKTPQRTDVSGGRATNSNSYKVSHAKIREIEQQLQQWMEALPTAFKPGGDAPPKFARVQQLLRIAYAHAQMLLYRPFLHYLSPRHHVSRLDKRSYACAAACVSVARNIVHITGEMKRKGLLVGAYWFTIYTTFFAILTLVFVALDNQDTQTTMEVLKDAYEGKETLAKLAKRSMAADRCSVTLKALFDQLPGIVKERQSSVSQSRKRPASEQAPLQVPRIHPDAGQTINNIPAQPASNFPSHITNLIAQNTVPMQSAFYQQDASSGNSMSPMSSLNSPYGQQTNGLYGTASLAHESKTSTTSSYSVTPQSNFGMTPQQHLQQFNTNPGLTDLAAMMFPSADPFEYPNQPLSALESTNAPQFRMPFNSSANSSLTPYQTSTPVIPDFGLSDDTHVQLFGPMPPYLVQGQQPGLRMNAGGGFPGQDGFVQDLQDRTTGLQGVNLDELFGGQDWGGGVVMDEWPR